MRKRRLGRTGLMVSEIGLGGAWLLGRTQDKPLDRGVAVVHQALKLGIDYLDTAECYIGGRSESVLGAALAGSPDGIVVATKFGHRPDDFDFSSESVVASARASLDQLGRDSVDIFQLHTPAEPPWEQIFGPRGALEGMREVQARGWCRYLGITGRDVDFLYRCVETDAFDTLLVFNRYDVLDRSAQGVLAAAKAHDMGVILGSPLRMGLLGSARDEMFADAAPEEQQRIGALEQLFADRPGGITAAAIQFALAADAVSVVLSGAASPAEIEDSVAAAQTTLSPELLSEIERIAGA